MDDVKRSTISVPGNDGFPKHSHIFAQPHIHAAAATFDHFRTSGTSELRYGKGKWGINLRDDVMVMVMVTLWF